MGTFSWIHWVFVLAVILVLFGGRGKISELMGDFAKGIKSFKKGMADEPETPAEQAKTEPVKTIDHKPATAAGATAGAGVAGSPNLANRSETERRVEGSSY